MLSVANMSAMLSTITLNVVKLSVVVPCVLQYIGWPCPVDLTHITREVSVLDCKIAVPNFAAKSYVV